MKKYAKTAFALMSVALLATLTMSPALTYEAEAAPWIDEGTEEAIKWWLRVLPNVVLDHGRIRLYDP